MSDQEQDKPEGDSEQTAGGTEKAAGRESTAAGTAQTETGAASAVAPAGGGEAAQAAPAAESPRPPADERAAAAGESRPADSKAGGGKSSALNSRISSEVNLDTLLKVPVSLSIEVGRSRMPLSELLETREGTVIELERLLDEPLDILVNGSLIAHGVVVMANDRFGIQITDIVSPQERVRII